jgi:thioredoxin-related protein
MKKHVILWMFAFIAFGSVNAQPVKFIDGKWLDLKAQAKAENKYLLVDGYTDWCGFCELLEKTTFTDPKVVELINSRFIATRIDMEKGYGIYLGMKFRMNSFPTVLIFNPSGKLVYRLMGYQEATPYLESLKTALDPSKQESYPGISNEIELNFPQFYVDQFGGNGKRKWPAEQTVTGFIDQQKDLFDEISWSVMATSNLGKHYSQYLLDNLDKYRSLYGPEADDKLNNMLYSKLRDAIKQKNDSLFKNCMAEVSTYFPVEKKEEKIRAYSLTYYSEIKDWKHFTEVFEIFLEKNKEPDVRIVNEFCWSIYENCDAPEIIAKACKWMKPAIQRDAQYAYLDTYAALLYKNKEYTEAEKYANLAIKTGESAGEDVKSTQELLEKIRQKQ